MKWFWSKPKPSEPPYRVCKACGVLVIEQRAQEVIWNDAGRVHYCEAHRVPYDEVYVTYTDHPTTMYYRSHVRCDKGGVPIGYTKKR